MLNKFSKEFVKESSRNLKDALSVMKKPIFGLLAAHLHSCHSIMG